MVGFQPVALWGVKVPANTKEPVPGTEIEESFHIKMAAIDPTAKPKGANSKISPRATLKIVRLQRPAGLDMNMEDYSDEESSEDDESEEDSEADEGLSHDKKKVKRALAEAQINKLVNGSKSSDTDISMDDELALNGTAKKLKAKLESEDDSDSEESSLSDEEDGSMDGLQVDEFVLCTLDPEKTYQLPLDLVIAPDEHVFFQATGAFDIHLTGNYLITDSDLNDGSETDLPPGLEGLEDCDSLTSDEEDQLLESRISEIGSSDEDLPKVSVRSDKSKTPKSTPVGTNQAIKPKDSKKRAHDEGGGASGDLDAMVAAAVKENGGSLSKTQNKKLKTNEGKAVKPATDSSKADKSTPASALTVNGKSTTESPSTKKVSFADDKSKPAPALPKNQKGITKTIEGGVTINDRVFGKGPACKKGDKVGLYYVGKLMDGKQFDKIGKGKPFSFRIGAGEVIKGWDVGIIGMSIGGQRRVEIPAEYGYGNKVMPGIPANSRLQFDVKMMEIK